MPSNSNYKSNYGATKLITASAYLAELIIQRQTKWSKITLPDRFWLDNSCSVWTQKWHFQRRYADGLIKSGYDPSIIIQTLLKNENVGTLNNKRFLAQLNEAQRKFDNERNINTKLELTPTTELPVKQFGKQSKRSKLD